MGGKGSDIDRTTGAVGWRRGADHTSLEEEEMSMRGQSVEQRRISIPPRPHHLSCQPLSVISKRRQGSQGFVYCFSAFPEPAAVMVTASASLLSSPYGESYGKNGCCCCMNFWISIRQQCWLLSHAQAARVVDAIYRRSLKSLHMPETSPKSPIDL